MATPTPQTDLNQTLTSSPRHQHLSEPRTALLGLYSYHGGLTSLVVLPRGSIYGEAVQLRRGEVLDISRFEILYRQPLAQCGVDIDTYELPAHNVAGLGPSSVKGEGVILFNLHAADSRFPPVPEHTMDRDHPLRPTLGMGLLGVCQQRQRHLAEHRAHHWL